MISVYMLGCDEFPERKDATLAHLRERGVLCKYWRSVAGRSWGLETLREYDTGRRISPGHVGLCLGFWNLVQHLSLTLPEDDAAIIFEDDVVLPPTWHSELRHLLLELDRDLPDWQLVYLGVAETEPNCWGKITQRLGGPNGRLCRMDCPFGTHALMLRPSALPVILQNMAVAERNLDQQLWGRVLSKGLLRWCAVLPTLVRQRTYDHDLTGKPEWAPSTLDENRSDTPARVSTERERDRKEQKLRNVPVDGDDSPGKPSARTYAMTAPMVDPFPCLYRGEFLEEPGVTEDGRTAPLSQCAQLEVPCHSRRGRVVKTPRGALVRACETCDLRLGMATPGAVRPRLPLPEGHFNCSMAVYYNGLYLATRDSWGHSRVGLWKLTNPEDDWTGPWTCHPISSLASDHPEAPRLEDPRLFVHRGRLHAAFNLPDGYPPKLVQVGYVRFSPRLDKIEETVVFPSPHGNLYEKNWLPISAGDEIRWVYQAKPEQIVLDGKGRPFCSIPNPLPWVAGVIRGGATPVLVGGGGGDPDVYYSFFHGCIKRIQGSVYTMGCAVFEAKPPYRVLRQTRKPLAWPDLQSFHEETVKRYVLWPGGAVPHAGAWHIACGIDDTFCRIVRIPFDTVERALTDVPEDAPALTIRNTPLAKGSKA